MKQRFTLAAAACLMAGAALAAQGGAAQPTGGQGSGQKPATSQGSAGEKMGGASAGAAAQKGGAAADAMFMRTAAEGGMAEVEHGRLATQNASSAEVKQFAQRMVDDHGKANDELKAIASQKNVTLPTELNAKHKAMQDKLSKMKGAQFDRAYMAHMVSAHAQAVALYQKEAKGGSDPEARAFAEKTLPTVQEHHKMAQSINAKLKGGAAEKPGGTPQH